MTSNNVKIIFSKTAKIFCNNEFRTFDGFYILNIRIYIYNINMIQV